MHQLIASPFLGQHLIVAPGEDRGVRIAATRFAQLGLWEVDEMARTHATPHLSVNER